LPNIGTFDQGTFKLTNGFEDGTSLGCLILHELLHNIHPNRQETSRLPGHEYRNAPSERFAYTYQNYFWVNGMREKGNSKEAAMERAAQYADLIIKDGADLESEFLRKGICGIIDHVYGDSWQ
jgi:hypothetical protein